MKFCCGSAIGFVALAASPPRVVCRATYKMRQQCMGYFTARVLLIHSSCVLSAPQILADVCVNKKLKSTSGVTFWLRGLKKKDFPPYVG